MITRRSAAFALFLVSVSSLAQAQVPGPASPGRIEERFKPPPKSQSTPEITIPGPEAPTPPEAATKIHFQLVGVVIEGGTVFSQSELSSLYASLLGKDITLAQIFEVRDAITAKYRSAGYVLSQAIIPPQKITGGLVHIRIVEGYVDNIEFEGEGHDSRGLIQEYAGEIMTSRPLKVGTLERYVLLANDIPGLSVRTVIKPSETTPGAATLVFVLEHRSVGGQVEADNRGSVAIGPEQGQVEIDLNSLLGLDEQTALLLATTGQPKELQYGQLRSSWILDSDGTRFDLSASYSDSKPGGAIALLDAIGHTLTAHAGSDWTLIRSRPENLHVTVTYTYLNTTTDLLGTKFSEDRLRYASLGATYDVADTLVGDAFPATNLLNVDLSQGFNILDASKTGSLGLSRANGHSDFTRLYAEATRTQALTDSLSLVIAASGQVAASPLLTPVQFGVGGSRFGRGYEPSELTGDDGIAGTLEGRYDVPLGLSFIAHPQLYAFYDIGQIWNIDPLFGTPAQSSLASAGLGVRFGLLSYFFVDLELAKPLTRPIASRGNKDIRPLFNISAQF